MGEDTVRKAASAAGKSSTGSVVFNSGGTEGVAVGGGEDGECWIVTGGREEDREWIKGMAEYGQGGG